MENFLRRLSQRRSQASPRGQGLATFPLALLLPASEHDASIPHRKPSKERRRGRGFPITKAQDRSFTSRRPEKSCRAFYLRLSIFPHGSISYAEGESESEAREPLLHKRAVQKHIIPAYVSLRNRDKDTTGGTLDGFDHDDAFFASHFNDGTDMLPNASQLDFEMRDSGEQHLPRYRDCGCCRFGWHVRTVVDLVFVGACFAAHARGKSRSSLKPLGPDALHMLQRATAPGISLAKRSPLARTSRCSG
eukprot:scaffold7068_cov301-Pinguiococcus_pyrenoidosus.AAC.8